MPPADERSTPPAPLGVRLLVAFVRFFLHHLYTTLAFLYDFVAWAVSAGSWQTWQTAALQALPRQGALLELGHGPGRLMIRLAQNGRAICGIDASPQMCRLAARRCRKAGVGVRSARAAAQALPFPGGHFASIIATFPSEFILSPQTLCEAWRVLRPGGLLVIVISAQITGRSFPDPLLAWLFRVTHEYADIPSTWLLPFQEAGFSTRLDRVVQQRAVVQRLVCQKPSSAVDLQHA
jgi:ubiquinone/menaquinone biosynthesis C-methylase UbiE